MLINDASITGSLIVNASASFQNINVAGNIIPDTTNIRNLGSTDKYFKEIYVSTGSINFVDNGSVVAVLSAGTITTIQSNTSSANSRLSSIENVSASLQTFTASVSATNTFTSSATARLNSIETISASNIARLSALETTSASVDTLNTTQNNRLGSLETISASNLSRISALETTSASVDTLNTTQNSRLNSLEIKTGSLATTGSNTFIGTQTITGSLFISADLIVQGTSSLENITASAVSIGTNIVNLNTANPAIRYAGLSIGDSGSIGSSGSFLYDSVQDEFIFVHRGANTTVTSSVILMGPQTFDSIGNETYLTTNRIPKGAGNEHLADSNISDTGTLVTINSATQITGSLLISSSLNVGSSNGSPLSKISFRDGVNTGSIALGNANYPTLLISDANNGEFRIDNRTSFAGGFISFYPNGQEFTPSAEAARIATNGYFGIGNQSPTSQLSVYTSSANTQNIMAELYNGNYTSGTRNFIRVRNNINAGSTMSSYFGQGQDGKTYIISNDFTKNHIVIDGNTANVGIGISTPNSRLEVKASDTGTTTNYASKNIIANSPLVGGYTGAPIVSMLAMYDGTIHGADIGYLYDATGYGLAFSVNNDTIGNPTEAMRINRAGNVGVGITNPAVSLDISAKTDGIILPVGTTGQRPTAANGLIRYNTNAQSLETYVANNWVNVQTSANNGYGWRRPSTINIGGVLADGDRTWYSEINIANSYGAVVLNHVFTGNFTVVASWQRNFMGIGMMYKSGATLLDFDGYSLDPTGPYFGGTSVSGFSVGTYNSYSYLGRYPAPLGSGEIAGTKYFFKWQRSGNSLTMQYSTTGPWGAWTNFGAGASATCSSGDSVIVGAGEASGTENDPLRLLYVIE